MRQKYETDLTDEQWEVIAPLFVNMRNRKWAKRELVNAVLYLVIFRRFLPCKAFWDKIQTLIDSDRCRRADWLSFIRRNSQSKLALFTKLKKLKPHGWQVKTLDSGANFCLAKSLSPS